ncbi:lysozyme C II-like [Eleutherodactylus coqui]|uniref:lysozyme C II-like n=1 Tax=Eleutherodactylus coqui TaxID=57060 RepID=UPI003461DE7B
MKIFIILILSAFASGIRLDKCTVMQKIRASGLVGMKGYRLGDYMCVFYYTSYYDTRLNNSPTEYGMCQIASKWWCDDGRTPSPRNLCGKKCSDFLNDDITDDLQCVKRIVADPNGLGAWSAWKISCQGRNNYQFETGC